jgi:hypothetical protein
MFQGKRVKYRKGAKAKDRKHEKFENAEVPGLYKDKYFSLTFYRTL